MAGENKGMIFDKLQDFGSQIALVDDKKNEITYRELTIQADQITNNMKSRSIVFSMCQNSIESVTGYVGFLRNDIVPVLLSSDIDVSLFDILCETYAPAYIWCPKEKAAMAKNTKCIYEYRHYVLLETNFTQDYSLNEELALLLTTSGSTGSPKLVRQSKENLISNTKSIVEYLKILNTDRAITTLPMNYTYGLSILNTHLYCGATMILTEASLMNKEFWTLIKEQKATTFGGVPYIYEILKKLRFSEMDLPSLRYLTQAGGKLSKEMAEEFNDICVKKKIQMIIMYGQTEATARMSYLPWENAAKKAGSIGIAIPGGKFELIDTDDKIIYDTECTGELIYYGDNVTLGYAENRWDLSKGDENNKRLCTGDMAKRDKDGFYYIVGRKKRFLKIFGNRVNLDEVESLLKREEIENVCVGTDDHMRIYITDPQKESIVKQYIINHTKISSRGFTVHLIEKIPRNESGKVLYSALGEKE